MNSLTSVYVDAVGSRSFIAGCSVVVKYLNE
jgi:hypothetical protein